MEKRFGFFSLKRMPGRSVKEKQVIIQPFHLIEEIIIVHTSKAHKRGKLLTLNFFLHNFCLAHKYLKDKQKFSDLLLSIQSQILKGVKVITDFGPAHSERGPGFHPHPSHSPMVLEAASVPGGTQHNQSPAIISDFHLVYLLLKLSIFFRLERIWTLVVVARTYALLWRFPDPPDFGTLAGRVP